MDASDARRIHDTSLALLDDPGVRIEDEATFRLLLDHGARPGDGQSDMRLPAGLVDRCLASCPREVALGDRRGGVSVLTATSPPVFWSCPGMTLYHRGVHRPFTRADMAAAARLLDQLDHVQAVFGLAMDDVPPAARDVVGLATIARHTSKHVRVLCFSPEGADRLVEMQGVVAHSPWFSIGFTAHGPLRWTKLALEIFRRTAGHGIPVSINGEPTAGVTGPVTLAGAAAVGNAEILAGIVINQLFEPGRPCIYNLGLAHTLDMRAAVVVTGGPENAVFARIAAAMGRLYGLPSASWVSTEALVPDAQAGLEKMLGWQSHAADGVSCIWGVGQLESEMTFSPAQAVLDNEMIGYVRRVRRGALVSDEALALDVTRQVGIGGSFLESDHTLDHFRDELFLPQVLFRGRRAAWEEAGRPSLEERAETVADELAARETTPGLSEDQLRELDRIAAAFAARAAM